MSEQRDVLLVLRALGLGDFLTAVPALRALRRAQPAAKLVLAAPSVLAPLVAACGAVDRLFPVPAYVREPMAGLGWGGARPAVAVNLHGRGPQSHRALLSLDPDRLLGFACPPAGFSAGPAWTADEHEVDRWCRLLGWYGIAASPSDLLLPPPPVRPQWTGAAVLHPGASESERCWPVARFADVARQLRADGHRVLLTGSPAELARAMAVGRAAGVPSADVLAGRTPLAVLAAIVARARLVVCGDTGIAHLATAYRTPSVVLFGPVAPASWGPPAGRAEHVALWHGPDGLPAISVAEVMEAARALLGGVCDATAPS